MSDRTDLAATSTYDVLAERLAVSKKEAANLLGVSIRFFDAHLRSDLPVVLIGRRRLYPVSALEEWLAEQSRSPRERLDV
jgi:hypothetical protein